MKVYLDDERATPEGWHRVYWPDEAIALLQTEKVTEISLDHDLGDDQRGTGYDVILWIEEAVITRGFVPPKISVHSANSSAREKMELGIQSIQRHSMTLERSLAEFMGAFEMVFRHDWAYTNVMINGMVMDGANFLEPGLIDESEDWGARGALLEKYRTLSAMMKAKGISPISPFPLRT
jgi:hypothetical protein